MQFLACTQGTQGNAETFRWLCKPMILLIEHLQGPTEVQMNSWCYSLLMSDQSQLDNAG